MNITNLTWEQLLDVTKAQIITQIDNKLNNMTKRQIITFLLEAELISVSPVCTYRLDGQIESQTDVTRDVGTGDMISGRVITWTYYPGGEVDTIAISRRNEANAEIGRTVIKHFVDGRQPEVSQ